MFTVSRASCHASAALKVQTY